MNTIHVLTIALHEDLLESVLGSWLFERREHMRMLFSAPTVQDLIFRIFNNIAQPAYAEVMSNLPLLAAKVDELAGRCDMMLGSPCDEPPQEPNAETATSHDGWDWIVHLSIGSYSKAAIVVHSAFASLEEELSGRFDQMRSGKTPEDLPAKQRIEELRSALLSLRGAVGKFFSTLQTARYLPSNRHDDLSGELVMSEAVVVSEGGAMFPITGGAMFSVVGEAMFPLTGGVWFSVTGEEVSPLCDIERKPTPTTPGKTTGLRLSGSLAELLGPIVRKGMQNSAGSSKPPSYSGKPAKNTHRPSTHPRKQRRGGK